MIRPLTIAIAILPLLCAAAVAEPERPALRSDALVTGNVVRIGDLVEHAGIVANVAVFRAPALGQTGTISTAQVLEALSAHALVGLDPGPIAEITVTRASRTITAHEIEAVLAAKIAKTYGLGDATDIALNFERTLRTIYVEPTVTAAPRIEHLRYDARTGRFEATTDIPGAPYARLRMFGTAVVTGEAVEVQRPIARGEVLKMDDLVLRRVPRAQISSDTITDPDQAVGLASRNALAAGRPLRNTELTKPELVQRGESVTIVYQVPGVTLAVRGKAASGGAEGDMIDVVNVQSNRTLRATIVGPGQVVVASMVPRVIAAADANFEPPARAYKK